MLPHFLIGSLIIASILALPRVEQCSPSPDRVNFAHLPNYTSPDQPCMYSGFAPLDQNNRSAVFYWYFTSEQPVDETPLILYISGQPGNSTVSSIFTDNGPFTLTENDEGGYSVHYRRNQSDTGYWSRYYNVLYMDSPIGVGYSYTTDDNYPQDMDSAANQLYTAITYFISKIHSTVNDKPWYIAGDSFGARQAAALASRINIENMKPTKGLAYGDPININLQGFILGDGFMDGLPQRLEMIPASNTGNLANKQQLRQAETMAVECQNQWAQNPNSTAAVDQCDQIRTYLEGISSVNLTALDIPIQSSFFAPGLEDYLNNQAVIEVLMVNGSKKDGDKFQRYNEEVYDTFYQEILSGDVSDLNSLFQNKSAKGLVYAGNFDARNGIITQYEWLKKLKYPYNKIADSNRNIYYANGYPIGTYQMYDKLVYVQVYHAGAQASHFVNRSTIQMLNDFFSNNFVNVSKGYKRINNTMCDFMLNCSGNGKCNNNGICECDTGYGLADCSASADVFEQFASYTLNPRQYLFLKFKKVDADTFMTFNGEDGKLEVHYSSVSKGPVSYYGEAETSLFASNKSVGVSRSIYLPEHSSDGYAYLTIQNTHYFKSVTFQATQYTKEGDFYIAKLGFISFYGALMVISVILFFAASCIYCCYRKKLLDEKGTSLILDQSNEALLPESQIR